MKQIQKKVRPQKLAGLGHFTGTENYYRHTFGGRFTDGVKHVVDIAQAYWLLDVIFSHGSTHRNQSLLVCKLVVDAKTDSAEFTMDDGDGNILATQHIEFTDFPVLEQTIWLCNGVAMLPSEY